MPKEKDFTVSADHLAYMSADDRAALRKFLYGSLAHLSAVDRLADELGDYMSSDGVVSPACEILQAACDTLFDLRDTREMIRNLEEAERELSK